MLKDCGASWIKAGDDCWQWDLWCHHEPRLKTQKTGHNPLVTIIPSYTVKHPVKPCHIHTVNIPDVSTEYVSDWRADKFSLASDGSLVSGSNLLPLVLTTLFLLISDIFFYTWLGFWSVGRGSFCSMKMKKKKKHFRGPVTNMLQTDIQIKRWNKFNLNRTTATNENLVNIFGVYTFSH